MPPLAATIGFFSLRCAGRLNWPFTRISFIILYSYIRSTDFMTCEQSIDTASLRVRAIDAL